MSRERRLAENELLFRTLNERVKEVAERTGAIDNGAAFLCECADAGCAERVRLSAAGYEEVRADPQVFLVVPGHEVAQVEQVVADRGTYLLVRKSGEAGVLAAADADS